MHKLIRRSEAQVIETQQYRESLAALPVRVQQTIKRKIRVLQTDRAYPGLCVHRIERAREKDTWSCYVGRGHRVLFRFEHAEDGTEALRLLDVGGHELVDRHRH